VAIGSYTPKEFEAWERRLGELEGLRLKSRRFGERIEKTEENIEEERSRRKLIGHLQGKRMGRYEGDPVWDDVVPIPQDDGEGALAAIAYTDEYAEGKQIVTLFLKIA